MTQLFLRFLMIGAMVALLGTAVMAQRDTKDAPKSGSSKAADDLVKKLLAFDKNKDGKLTREEITDERLLGLFDRADTNKDGVVTVDELKALAAKETGDDDRGGKGGKGPGGKGQGGKGGFGKGGFGKGGFGRPQPGQIMPEFILDRLELTEEQKKQFETLQKDVDGKIGKILTEKQKKQLKDMMEEGPGGRGGKGGERSKDGEDGGKGGKGKGGKGGKGKGRPDDVE